jgi:hypothetical protein
MQSSIKLDYYQKKKKKKFHIQITHTIGHVDVAGFAHRFVMTNTKVSDDKLLIIASTFILLDRYLHILVIDMIGLYIEKTIPRIMFRYLNAFS